MLLANAELNAAFLAVTDVIMARPFLDEARRLGPRGAKPLEMFARCFEAHLFDWLRHRGRVSQYFSISCARRGG
jgi:hypothetical protein